MWKLLSKLMKSGVQCVYCQRDIPASQSVQCCKGCKQEEKLLLPINAQAGGVWHVFRYEGIIRKLMHSIKYDDQPALIQYVAQQMCWMCNKQGLHADAVSFVPVHKNRLAERGFDQSELLASLLSVELKLPFLPMFDRIKDTTPQFELGRSMRARNVRNAFEYKPAEYISNIAPRMVFLVDDICTTGATINACAACLPQEIQALPIVFSHEY